MCQSDKGGLYDSRVRDHVIVHLGLNVKSSAHNCGCVVDCGNAIERAIILVLYLLMLYSIMGISTALSAYFTAHSATHIVSTSLKIRVNVMQSVYLVRSALPYLNSSQGTIAVMSSASGEICMCECMYMYGCTQGGSGGIKV